ncbi:HEPN domain-containing protein [Undibacterium umbellatum]|uniref:Apea-like HEPN domain-containing protein n=1 Tax=Undibacterium umbellatum TaxID=2762300 RepID=A0ABR6ZIQ1_9BURK|nr:HEPN domain-containing protein [Undibacterium umbellatum]MBC3911602.1 hypothetical protein [Undibacterium umbellatum]
MRAEFLILIPDNDSFCNTKKGFVDILKIDSLISITGQNLAFRRSPKSKDIVSVKFRVDTAKVKSQAERYFLFSMECEDQNFVDEFFELCEKIKAIVQRISPGSTSINVLWDDVGRIYAEKSYPIINETENLMRRLIAKFMLITVGMNWSKDAFNDALQKKIKNFGDEDTYLNDLYKLDFIHLNEVLFEKKRDIGIDELTRLLSKTNFSKADQEQISKYVPRSNWEKYFSELVDKKDSSLETKWKMLYELRNKVAHNRNVKKAEFEKIKGLSTDIKIIIDKAISKLGDIDINADEREIILESHFSELKTDVFGATSHTVVESVAEYFVRNGFGVQMYLTSSKTGLGDFSAGKDGDMFIVEVITHTPLIFSMRWRELIKKYRDAFPGDPALDPIPKLNVVVVVPKDAEIDRVPRIKKITDPMEIYFIDALTVTIGTLTDDNVFVQI